MEQSKAECSEMANSTIFDMQYVDTVPPLSKAVILGNIKEIKKLLLSGKLPQATDNRGWTAIHYCVSSNQLKALRLILKMRARNKRHLVNLVTWDNYTPLALAFKCQSPSLELVKTLLTAGANPNMLTHTNLSPLHLASMKRGSIEFVKLLVQHGAHVNIQDDLSKSTPLHLAAGEAKDSEILKYLLEISDTTIENCHGKTAFFEACSGNFTEGLKIFLDFDKNMARTECCVPALVESCYLGNLEAVELLIKAGADVNKRCKALVSDPAEPMSEWILLDIENYLPIHSALSNLQLFKLMLSLTIPEEVLKLNSHYCSFPLFIMIHTNDILYYEALLQSHYPEELKNITLTGLVNFCINCTWEMIAAVTKFPFCFTYNFQLDPSDIFENITSVLSKENILKYLKFLHYLALMGLSSSESQVLNKEKVIKILEEVICDENESSDDCHLAKSTHNILKKSVLSLKQLCRIVMRRYIQSSYDNNWLAYTAIRKSNLPECLKRFLLYETI